MLFNPQVSKMIDGPFFICQPSGGLMTKTRNTQIQGLSGTFHAKNLAYTCCGNNPTNAILVQTFIPISMERANHELVFFPRFVFSTYMNPKGTYFLVKHAMD